MQIDRQKIKHFRLEGERKEPENEIFFVPVIVGTGRRESLKFGVEK